MRVIVFYITLFILLLSGGNSYSGIIQHTTAPQKTTTHFHKNQKSKINHKNNAGTLTNNIDVDLEEDFSGSDEVKTIGKNKFIPLKTTSPYCTSLTATNLLVLNNYYKNFKTSPLSCGHTTPIYISLGVLRI